MRKAGIILSAAAVSACSANIEMAPPRAAPAPQPRVEAPVPQPSTTGDQGKIIGSAAAALLARFGSARIDLKEGDARKLQFVSGSCVLDIFLYPSAGGAEPVATYVESRARDTGSPTDQRRCIRAVEGSR